MSRVDRCNFCDGFKAAESECKFPCDKFFRGKCVKGAVFEKNDTPHDAIVSAVCYKADNFNQYRSRVWHEVKQGRDLVMLSPREFSLLGRKLYDAFGNYIPDRVWSNWWDNTTDAIIVPLRWSYEAQSIERYRFRLTRNNLFELVNRNTLRETERYSPRPTLDCYQNTRRPVNSKLHKV